MPAKPPPINLKLSNARVNNPANLSRRNRYANNLDYRRKIIEANKRRRMIYSAVKIGPWHDLLSSICSPGGTAILRRFAGTRTTTDGKSVMCFSSVEVAGILQKCPETLSNWRTLGYMAPTDITGFANNGNRARFYSMDYVLRLARCLSQVSSNRGALSRRRGKQLRQMMDAG